MMMSDPGGRPADSAFLKNYRNNMLDLQTAAARVRSSEAGEGIPVAMSADPTVAAAWVS